MGKNVFANGKEVSCRKDDNKSVAAMPDVCLSPPSPPAGPVPIPYPNTAMASDTTDGSKTVKIGDDEIGMKNSSSYKQSSGDEAATKTFGMGVVSHNIQGKMKHAAWSFDVKIEGMNAIRHMDLTTHNHINCDNKAVGLNQAAESAAFWRELSCDELAKANSEARANETGGRFKKGGTLTNAYRLDGAGNGRYMMAMCPHNPKAEFQGAYQPSLPENASQPPCSGSPPRKAGAGRINDAENKLLYPEMMAGKGGMIKMSTWHGGDAAPCYSCRQSICEAEKCGIEVWLCKSSNTPPEAVRPAKAGLCPPDKGKGDYDPKWQAQGLGDWPKP
jgi:Domain of unknown function (DUF4150)